MPWRKYLDEQARQARRKSCLRVRELANVAGAFTGHPCSERRTDQASPPRSHSRNMPTGYTACRVPYRRNSWSSQSTRMLTSLATMRHCAQPRDPDAHHDFLLYGLGGVRTGEGAASRRSGELVFACVRSGVYFPATAGAIASPAQALCDYVYLARRSGIDPEALVTFRNLGQVARRSSCKRSRTIPDQRAESTRRAIDVLE